MLLLFQRALWFSLFQLDDISREISQLRGVAYHDTRSKGIAGFSMRSRGVSLLNTQLRSIHSGYTLLKSVLKLICEYKAFPCFHKNEKSDLPQKRNFFSQIHLLTHCRISTHLTATSSFCSPQN